MHVFQRAKAPLPFLRKAQMTRLSLVFASLLLCSMIVPLFLSAGTARAASLSSRSAKSSLPLLMEAAPMIRPVLSGLASLRTVHTILLLMSTSSIAMCVMWRFS
jgi:hypothetical protein